MNSKPLPENLRNIPLHPLARCWRPWMHNPHLHIKDLGYEGFIMHRCDGRLKKGDVTKAR